MELWINVDMANAAFEGDEGDMEIVAVLREIANTIEAHGLPDEGSPDPVRDSNGNVVGAVQVGRRKLCLRARGK